MADPVIPQGTPRPGGMVANRMNQMEQIAGAPVAPAPVAVAPAPVAPPVPAPVTALSPEELALRRKYGMAIPGQAPAPTTLMGRIKSMLGFAPPPAPPVVPP